MANYTGIIDLGSNTVRLVIYYCDNDGFFHEYEDVKFPLRLINDLQPNCRISEQGFVKTLECLRQFKAICDSRQVSEIIGVATAAVRQARNGLDLLRQIEQELDIHFRLLSGEEESHYGYLAIVNSMSIDEAVTIDIGGGSTEITYFRDRKLIHKASFPFGVVNLTSEFLKHENPTADELSRLKTYVREQFLTQPWLSGCQCALVALGGTARNAAKIVQREIHYSLASVHNFVMSRNQVNKLRGEISQMTPAERRQLDGLSKDRDDIILAGLEVFCSLLDLIDSDRLITSRKGLRDGILFEKILNRSGLERIEDVALFGAQQFITRYGVNRVHAEHVGILATSIYDQLISLNIIQMENAHRKLLLIASQLYGIGSWINPYESEQHTYYLLSHVLLPGTTHEERLMIAMIASYKNKKTLQKQLSLHNDIVNRQDQTAIEILGHLAWLARTLDFTMNQKVVNVTVKTKNKMVTLECVGLSNHTIEYLWVKDIAAKVSKVLKRTVKVKDAE
ncbi:MAG: hypothetical protein JWN30_2517 [Bacilli bacterium]|nr:hypothetical protein [Bacilli bacterium]